MPNDANTIPMTDCVETQVRPHSSKAWVAGFVPRLQDSKHCRIGGSSSRVEIAGAVESLWSIRQLRARLVPGSRFSHDYAQAGVFTVPVGQDCHYGCQKSRYRVRLGRSFTAL